MIQVLYLLLKFNYFIFILPVRTTPRQDSTISNETETEVQGNENTNQVEDSIRVVAPAFDTVLEEINNLNMSGNQIIHEPFEQNNDSLELGPEQIIQEMDHDVSATDGLRRRRVDYFNSTSTELIVNNDSVPVESVNSDKKDNLNQIPEKCKIENEIRIKLKYLNDDLKLVKGTASEAIGDFKK